MKIEAFAKVNYTLEVFAKRVDGYHALRSIVLPISLSDTLEFSPCDAASSARDRARDRARDAACRAASSSARDAAFAPAPVTSDSGFADDLIVKAGKVLSSSAAKVPRLGVAEGATCARGAELACGAALLPRFHVRVTKRIPVGGGLGGGSADAAATLLALNALWGLDLSAERLAEIGADVGSDVPALVLAQHYRRAVMMEGRGECVRLCEPSEVALPSCDIVLANPGIHSVTRDVFALFDSEPPATGIANNLEPPALALYPAIASALDGLRAAGADAVRMSGSGATVFGFAPDGRQAAVIAERMRQKGHQSWPAKILI